MSRQQFLRDRKTVPEKLDPKPMEIPLEYQGRAEPSLRDLVASHVRGYLRQAIESATPEEDSDEDLAFDDSEPFAPWEVEEMTDEVLQAPPEAEEGLQAVEQPPEGETASEEPVSEPKGSSA